MNKKFIIACDSACDLTKDICDELEVFPLYFTYTCGEKVFEDRMNSNDLKIFYDGLRQGNVYKTSQINIDKYYSFFKELLKYNMPIMFISLGIGVSNTVNNALKAKELILKENEAEIDIINSKIASLGIGLLINKACKLRDDGMDLSKATKIIEESANNIGVFYTTDTMKYFARGGRITKVKSLIAGVLRINVVLDCNSIGSLRIVSKCHGKNKAKKFIIESIKKTVINPEEQVLYVCGADCKDEAVLFATEVVNQVGFKRYYLTDMGTIIGSHTGPGLISLFYEGKKRE